MALTDKLSNIATAIRNKTGKAEKMTLEEMAIEINNIEASEGVYEQGFAAGVKSEYDRFWDNYQLNGERTHYRLAFSNSGWTDEIFTPKYDITPVDRDGSNMFQNSWIVDLKGCLERQGVKLDLSRCTTLLQMFQSSKIKYFPEIDARNATSLSYTWGSGSQAETIDKLMVSEKATFPNAFSSSIKHVIFEGVIASNDLNLSVCVNLDKESLLSVIDCLKDFSEDTSGTAHTVTLGSTNLAKLTEDELHIVKEKGWTIS